MSPIRTTFFSHLIILALIIIMIIYEEF
jgi:hypothetical protein